MPEPLADEPDCGRVSTFDVEVAEPDPNDERKSMQRQGEVIASCAGVTVGSLAYGLGPGDRVAIVRVEVEAEFQRQGCATQMVQELGEHFPERRVVDGGNENSNVGDLALARWRERGLVAYDG